VRRPAAALDRVEGLPAVRQVVSPAACSVAFQWVQVVLVGPVTRRYVPIAFSSIVPRFAGFRSDVFRLCCLVLTWLFLKN
jgi:hypothetical protein